MKIICKRIKELGKVVTGKTPPTADKHFYEGEYPFVTPADLDYDTYKIIQTQNTVSREAKSKFSRLILPPKTIAYTCIASVGKIGITTKESLSNQQINSIIPYEDYDYLFIYYLMMHNTRKIKGIRSGAVADIINKTDFEKIKVQVPESKKTREKIGTILSLYDELIQINKQKINLLNHAARYCYREWFVYFRFPGHEKIKLIDGVPENWRKRNIGDVTSYLNRGITPRYDEDADSMVINQKCIRNSMLSLDLVQKQSNFVPKKKKVQKGDVLVNSTGEGTLGRVAFITSPITDCTVDSHITITRPTDSIGEYYFGLFMVHLEEYLSIQGRGATNQSELSKETIAKIPILIPDDVIRDKFEIIASNIYSMIFNFQNQNNLLSQARNLLLPKILNGEIEL
jgi:type I restriction enzyme S subunit